MNRLTNSSGTGDYGSGYPAGNVSYVRAVENYMKLMKDSSTFGKSTIESLLNPNMLPDDTATVFQERYLW
jgi:hypothetical protein